MSIYFDSKIVIPEGSSSSEGQGSSNYGSAGFGKKLFLDIEWHLEQQLLAISHSDEKNGACVSVYDHLKEETLNIDSGTQQGVQVTAIKWHPKGRILALGYESGELVIWNHEEGEVFEGSRGHSASIMLMEWSIDGALLVSSDNMGILIIWKSDSQGHLQTHFIHDFKDPVCHIVFRQQTQPLEKTRDDDTERVLGMMTTWRPKTGRNRGERSGRQTPRGAGMEEQPPEEKCFFVGVLSGTIYYLKESGSNEEILSSGSSIRSLLFYSAKEMLIILTEAQIMGHFHISGDGDLTEINKMKVGGRGDMRLFWVGKNTLAVIGRDPTVRLWDVDTALNSVLEAKPNEVGEDETFLSLDYHPKDGVLCCCTNKGKLVMWKEVEPPSSALEDGGEEGHQGQTDDGHWEAMSVTMVPSSSKCAKWCPSTSGLLAVNALQDIMLLKEQELCFHFGHQVSIVQTQPSILSVQLLATKKSFDIKVDMQIKGVTASEAHVVFWNGNKVVTYEFGAQITTNYKFIGSFANKSDSILIQEMSLYMQELGQIQVRTFQGTIKQTLAFSGTEGPPITVALGGDYLTSGSEYGFIKIWHIGRREAKLHTSPKNLNDHVERLGEIIYANTNCNGTKIGFTVAKVNLVPDSRLYVMDLATNAIQEVNFPSQFIEKFFWEAENPSYLALEVRNLSRELQTILDNESYDALRRGMDFNKSKSDSGKKVSTLKYIKPCKDIRRTWRNKDSIGDEDENEVGRKFSKKHLLRQNEDDENFRKTTDIQLPPGVDHAIITFFADSEKGILIHEKRMELQGKFLVGLEVPYIYLADNGTISQKDTKQFMTPRSSLQNSLQIQIDVQVIPEFDGVEDEHKEGRAALMKYVYHSLFNDIDGALRAIRFIKNEKIYSNMVRNCVKTRRMDVALLSLSKMKEARMAREVRNAIETEPEPAAHVAMLAIQLGMLEEAESLYRECGRYDLLLELYVASEWWEKAIKLCETHRRIQLRSTYHAYGKSLEYDKKIPEAIEMYEKAETHRYEVPRMLVDDPEQLQGYIVKRKDKDLYLWWAQYLESTGDIESSLRYYELAHDWLSLVRLLCYLGSYEKAVQVANKVEDKASAYHLARTLEDNGELLKAIKFFSRAGAYGHAIRMCISNNNLVDELWALALKASPSEQADAAKYFETIEPPYYDRAIQLYHKAGYQSKALDLAFSSQEFSALQSIVRDIMNQPNMNTDPLLLQKCADFFVQNEEIDKALDMLCAAHKYPEAMDLCVHNNFTITDEIAERLTAPKGIGLDEVTRVGLLEKMGESCTIQGSYHLAAKKYTQAGNKIEAIKSLVKSGDTERIIFYANVSRHRDIYMIAAHYLQTTDWRNNPKVIQAIVQYYTKAQAFESLAGFYETAAESEIENGRDYKKALEEYRKAANSWNDLLTCGARQYEDRCAAVEAKITFIGKFLKIKDTLHFDADTALSDLQKLLENPRSSSDTGVRAGDIYGLIVEHYVQEGEIEQAVSVLDQMRNYTAGKSLTHFLSPETTAKLEHALENSSTLMRIRSGSGKQRSGPSTSQNVKPNKTNANAKSATTSDFLPFLAKDENQNGVNGSEESDEVEEEEVVEDEEDQEIEEESSEEDGDEDDDDDGEEEVLYRNEGVGKNNPNSQAGFFGRSQQPYEFK